MLAAQYVDDQIDRNELTLWLVEHMDWLIHGPIDEARVIAEIVEFHFSEMSVFRSSEDALHQSLEDSLALNGQTSKRF